MKIPRLAILISILTVLVLSIATPSIHILLSQETKPLYVIFVWHYHQPWYYAANETYFVLPWVRMHSVGNYFKMAYILSKYPDIKVTFTFSGSLLYQLLDYLNGTMDYREILSWKIANGTELTIDEKFSMLVMPGGFFDINWKRIVDVVPRYRELRDRALEALQKYRELPEEEYKLKVVSEFTDQDFLDLAVLFNLFWIDPQVLKDLYPDLYDLRQQALTNESIHFTRDQLKHILEVHRDIMSRIIPIYRELLNHSQIEIIPVPYSHPLAPILTDFGWRDDLAVHVEKSIDLFRKVFNYTPVGVWPAEQAVNQFVLEVFSEEGLNWTVTDETLLQKAGLNPADPEIGMRVWYTVINGKKFYVFFRNLELSNLISFEYNKWDSKKAAQDLVNRLLSLAQKSDGTNVVVIALDGENPWEWYEEFGDVFLNELYSLLEQYQSQGVLKTITPHEYIEMFSDKAKELPIKTYPYLDLENRDIADIPLSYTVDAYTQLPRKLVNASVPEGSWAGGELAIWIGQRQENAAWMLLAKAREDILRALNTTSIVEAYQVNPRAIEYLLRAEASDWFWWYGGDAGGGFPTNILFKTFLRRAYEEAGLEPPPYLKTLFNPDATPIWVLNTEVPTPPKKLPKIDGSLGIDEWVEALNMSIGVEYISNVLLAPTPSELYIAIVPVNKSVLSNESIAIAIYFTTPRRSVSPYHLGYNAFPRYEEVDLGIGLFYELIVFPWNSTAIVSAADGRGGWLSLFWIPIAVGDVVELSIPWTYLALEPGDTSYVTVAVYYNHHIVETATRLGMVYQIQVPRAVAAVGAKVVFEMNDPEGDDDGAGGYVYPKAECFKPGVFDMLKFRVLDVGDKVVFEVFVKNLGGNPWNGPNGWSMQYIHIYIHTTLNITGRTDTYGLNIEIDPEYAWHIALLLAPGWGSDPVPKGERAALYYYNDTVVVQDGKFIVYADPARNAIVAEVSKDLLLDIEHIENWSYVVALTSYDGFGPMRIRPFGVEADVWVVGVGEKHAYAVLYNVVPRVMDLLAPTAEEQYKMLCSYYINVTTGEARPAIVRGYGPQALAAPPTPTTTTTTVTQTITTSYSITTTTTLTTTKTTTKTTTSIYTSISSIPITKTKTETIARIAMESLIAFSVGACAVGIAIGIVLTRRT